jgi:hypothetical protein
MILVFKFCTKVYLVDLMSSYLKQKHSVQVIMPIKKFTKKMSTKRKSRRSSRRGKSIQRKNNTTLNETPWKDLAPMKYSERRKMVPGCFLDQSNRKYPVCPKRVNLVTCKGLQAARARAVLNGDEEIVAKADIQKEVLTCGSGEAANRDVRIIKKSFRRSSRTNTERRSRRNSRIAARQVKKKPEPQLHHLTSVSTQRRYSKDTKNLLDV